MADEDSPTGGGSGGNADDASSLEGVILEMRACGARMVDLLATRATDNLRKVRAGDYDLDAWLDDVKFFWDTAINEARTFGPGASRPAASGDRRG